MRGTARHALIEVCLSALGVGLALGCGRPSVAPPQALEAGAPVTTSEGMTLVYESADRDRLHAVPLANPRAGYLLWAAQREPLIPKPGIPTSIVDRVLPLGTRAVLFSVSSTEGGHETTFVRDLGALYPSAAHIPRSWGGRDVSASGAHVALHEGDRLELLSLSDSGPPHERALPLSVEHGMFSGDERWYLAHAHNGELVAVPTTGDGAPVLLARGVSFFSTAPAGSGVTFTQIIDGQRQKLFYVDPRSARPVFVDLLKAWSVVYGKELGFEVWFSDDGNQLAYAHGADDPRLFALKMWKVGALESGHARGTFPIGSRHGLAGRISECHAYALPLRGGRGLLLGSGLRDYLDPASVWVVPWLGAEANSWRLPTEWAVRQLQQLGDTDLLVSHESMASGHSRLRSYHIGASAHAATLAAVDSSTDTIQDFFLAPTHVAYFSTRGEVGLQSLSHPLEPTRYIAASEERLLGFSPDGRYLVLIYPRGGQLRVVDVTTQESRHLSGPGHQVRNAFWLVPAGARPLRQPAHWQRANGCLL